MIIAEAREKCKSLLGRLVARFAGVPRDVYIVGVLVLASLFSFGLGYLAGLDAGSVTTLSITETSPISASTDEQVSSEKVVASKNGTKYYFPECAGASRISKENQVWFANNLAAISAGYTLATNCKSK